MITISETGQKTGNRFQQIGEPEKILWQVVSVLLVRFLVVRITELDPVD